MVVVQMPSDNQHPPLGRRHTGTCAHCGQPFDSAKAGKRYGNLACWLSSAEFLEVQAKAHELTRQRKALHKCACGCGEEVHRAPSKVKGRIFATKACRRKVYAERFDAWTASPLSPRETPANYDEFLQQEALPCPFCEWSGKHLSSHANRAHGVGAAELKRLLGFNNGTGLVAPSYKQHLQGRGAAHLPNGGTVGVPPPRFAGYRPEGKEHYLKGRAILRGARPKTAEECTE